MLHTPFLQQQSTPEVGRTPTLADEQGPVVSYTIPWANVPLIDFLNQASHVPRIYWENSNVSLSFAGFGTAARLTAQGANRFQTIQHKAQCLFNQMLSLTPNVPVTIGPRLFGGFSFKADHQPQGLWSPFPAAHFILPRYQLTRFNGQSWLTINHPTGPNDDPLAMEYLFQQEIEALQGAIVQFEQKTPRHLPAQPVTIKDVMPHHVWCNLVSQSTRRIRRGDLEKVVLARARLMQAAQPIEPTQALACLQQRYPDCYRFLFEPMPGHAFFGATPELLAEVSGATLRTVAMAGSIRRGQSPEEDEALGHQLMNTPKERHEHALVVEAIKENLALLVDNLTVPETPGLCRLNNIQHLQTVIQGELTGGHCHILPLVEALHPTPAVGGRSRQVALEMISQMEPTPRGWYAAPIGWINGQGDGMFAVAIRSAVSAGNESMLFAGAGIVADSVPENEWRETELKFNPLTDALKGCLK